MRRASHRLPLPFRAAALLAVAAFAAPAAPARAATFAVGVGAGCTHADLSSALVAAASNPGEDTVKLLAGSIHQGQFLASSSGGLGIVGGFATCGAAQATGTSTLRGDNASRALFLLASGGPASLERLQITGGSVVGDGGGLRIQGSSFVQLVDVLIFGNSATGRGGNLFVDASPGFQLSFFGTDLVTAGDALDGGGLACAGDGLIVLGSATTVANNAATGDGGGVHLAAGCALNSSAGGSTGGIVGNQAGGDGGGVYLEGGAEMNTGLSGDGLAAIDANSAGGRGGGAYVTGVGTVLRAFFAQLRGNHAGGAGGGVYADAGGLATFARPAGAIDPCFDSVRCSVVADNDAPIGGALAAAGGGRIDSHGTHVEGNSATLAAPVAHVESGGGVHLRSTVIAANDGANPIDVLGAGSELTLGNVTFAANTGFGTGLIHIGSGGVGPVRILTSAFDQPGHLFLSAAAGDAPQVDCVISRHADLFLAMPPDAVTRALTVADPQLANPAAGNYMLRGTSPAIDACDLAQWNADTRDVDWQPRDVDDPTHPNVLPGGFRDLGADEFGALFADGFESGDTGAWSDAVP